MKQESVREHRFEVARNHDGWRLDQYLTHKLGRLTRSQAQRIIKVGHVETSSSRRMKVGLILREGDTIVVRQTYGFEADWGDQVRVLEVTPSRVVLEKPAGMLVHPTANAYFNTLTDWAERSGYGRLHVVHRLDRETSGVIVFGRDSTSAGELGAQFNGGAVHKEYLALVVDKGRRHEVGAGGESSAPLGFDESSVLPRLKVWSGSWAAGTRWLCIGRTGEQALLKVWIEGGRQHQIRAHLAMFGTPIAGDKLYLHGDVFYRDWLEGKADTKVLEREFHALHAYPLKIPCLGIDAVGSLPPSCGEDFGTVIP